MVAMVVLDAAKERELVIGTHMQLKRPQTGQFPVVDTLGVLAVVLAARLPVALEHRACAIVVRRKLRGADGDRSKHGCHREPCNHAPVRAAPGHHPSYSL